MSDIYSYGIWRMDWGLGNPNKTAALIAMLLAAVWGLAYVRRRGFWLALALFTGLGICLIHTLSRGGIIAAGVGQLAVLWKARRPWAKSHVMGVSAAAWLIVGFSTYLQAHKRLGQGVLEQDRSITNRIEIWKATPQMMLDAPTGWGFGDAGNAYMQWYQPLNRTEGYRTLVNSHLTWLVEGGWLFRFFYLIGWLAVLALCWPSSDTLRWLSVPFGVWAAFAVAATFSSVAESIWLWIVPAANLLAASILRAQTRCWPDRRVWLGIALSAGTALALVALSGWTSQREVYIRGSKESAKISKTKPAIWIVMNEKILGTRYGKTLRGFLRDHPDAPVSMEIVKSISDVPLENRATVILAGEQTYSTLAKVREMSSSKLMLLNPAFYPQEANLKSSDGSVLQVLFGEFSQTPTRSAWETLVKVGVVEGAGDFLPTWPKLILKTSVASGP